MTDIILGIDIGLGGAISVFDGVSKELMSIYDMPTMKEIKNGKEKTLLDEKRLRFLFEIPKEHKDTALVVMENVHAFPGQGSVSTGQLMYQKGFIKGLADAFGYEVCYVTPSTWQKHFGIIPPKDLKDKTKRKKWLKEQSLLVARKKFGESWAENKLATKNDHGRSDSMLIGQWWLDTIYRLTSEEVALPEVVK
jgi:hypothetical protein